MQIFPDRAAHAIGSSRSAMRTTPTLAARGVIRVVNANMERAIRVITVERGYDPRDFALLAFGGAGPMHACELALDLGIRHIILPRNPGLLCAWGALGAPLGREYSMTIRDASPEYRKLVAARRADDEAGDVVSSRAKEFRADKSDMRCSPTCGIADNRMNSRSRSRRALSTNFMPRISKPLDIRRLRLAIEVVNLRLRSNARGIGRSAQNFEAARNRLRRRASKYTGRR